MNKESKLYDRPIGTYYFKYEGNDLILLRMYKIKTKNRFILKDEENRKVSLTKDQLSEFTMLEPDGLIIHVIASDPMQGSDTVCLLYRIDDFNNGISEPYAVCRQNIVDPFEILLNNDPSKTIVGVSISRDTAPEGFDFKMAYSANGIKYQQANFIYKDDSFEDIMSFVNEEAFDKTLKIVSDILDDDEDCRIKFSGYNSTYRDLLIQNDFMYDFRRAFNIVRFNFAIDKSIDRWNEDGIYKISEKEIKSIEGVTKHQVISPILIKYDKSVDLSEIKRSYIVFEDSNKDIYVISYDKGNYINREYDALSDQRDKELLQNKMYK